MEKKVIELATEEGFISSIIGKSVEAKYSNKDFYYLWMCELQKWLREVHGIHIQITTDDGIDFGWCLNVINSPEDSGYWRYFFKTYEEALEESLKQALILIREKNDQ
jgi:hypothetical protein